MPKSAGPRSILKALPTANEHRETRNTSLTVNSHGRARSGDVSPDRSFVGYFLRRSTDSPRAAENACRSSRDPSIQAFAGRMAWNSPFTPLDRKRIPRETSRIELLNFELSAPAFWSAVGEGVGAQTALDPDLVGFTYFLVSNTS